MDENYNKIILYSKYWVMAHTYANNKVVYLQSNPWPTY